MLIGLAIAALAIGQAAQLLILCGGWPGRFTSRQGRTMTMTVNADTQAFIDTVMGPRIQALVDGRSQAIADALAQQKQDFDATMAEVQADHADDLAALRAKLDALAPSSDPNPAAVGQATT